MKTFGLDPEDKGVLNGHRGVRFEFQETHPGCAAEGRLELGEAVCRQEDDVGAMHLAGRLP